MHADSSLIVYIRSGRSLAMYKHNPTIDLYALASEAESFWELSGICKLGSLGSFWHLALPNADSNASATFSTVVPGARIKPFSTSMIFLRKKVMWLPTPFSSSWLTVNRSFIFFKNLSFQNDLNPTNKMSSTWIMMVASGVRARHGCSAQKVNPNSSMRKVFKHKNHCFAPKRCPGKFLLMTKGSPWR